MKVSSEDDAHLLWYLQRNGPPGASWRMNSPSTQQCMGFATSHEPQSTSYAGICLLAYHRDWSHAHLKFAESFDNHRPLQYSPHQHVQAWPDSWISQHGPLTRYVKLWVAHAPECRKRFPHHCELAIATFVTAGISASGVWRMLGSLIIGFFKVGGGENVPGNPGACATRNFTYLARGPWNALASMTGWRIPTLRHSF